MWQLLTGRRRADTDAPPALASGNVIDGPALELVPASVLLGERVRQRLTAMRLESGMEETEFARLIMAPMAAIAAWVQQVPATPDEHHSEAGGLMRLAVECATVAMRRADGKLFHRPGSGPAGGVQSDTAWRHAAVLAALFCAIGRHVGHWRVQNAAGDCTWNPYACGLHEWVPKHSPGGYVITGAEPSNSVSRAGAGAWIAARCLDAGCLSRLQHGDGAPMGALVDVLGGHTESTLGGVVEAASKAVMAEDRNRARLHPARRMPPIQQQLLGVMRGLVQYRWNLNQPGGRLILGPDGVYLHWDRAAQDILARWRADHHADPGIGPEQLGALLLEHGLAEPNPDAADGQTPLRRVLVTPHEDGPHRAGHVRAFAGPAHLRAGRGRRRGGGRTPAGEGNAGERDGRHGCRNARTRTLRLGRTDPKGRCPAGAEVAARSRRRRRVAGGRRAHRSARRARGNG